MNPQTPQSNNPPQPNTPLPQQPASNSQASYLQTAYQQNQVSYQPTTQQPAPQPNPIYQQLPNQPQQVPPTTQPFTQLPQNPQLPTQQPSLQSTQPTPAKTTPPADNPNSTQTTLLISELRDSLVIMKDGSFRAVVACKSINFDLMSENEREGVEYSYQNFLNSLDFPIQILVRSQRVDIGPYIARLTETRKHNDNMLLGVLMDDYINFIDVLSQEANIMDKSFFIIIPYYSSADAEALVQQTKNIFATFKKDKLPTVTKIDRDTYDRAVTEINNRVDSIINGLFQIGIHSVRLNTRELSELYYNFNNPDTAVREPFIDFNKMATTYVRKGEAPQKGIR